MTHTYQRTGRANNKQIEMDDDTANPLLHLELMKQAKCFQKETKFHF